MPLELPAREPCPCCANLEGKISSDSNRIKHLTFIQRDETVAAFVNPYQHRQGAVLVIPTRHAATILDLSELEAESLSRLVRRVARGICDAFDPAGLNIFQNNRIASGQEIPHYHVHVMPRYAGEHPDAVFGQGAVLISFEERVRIT